MQLFLCPRIAQNLTNLEKKASEFSIDPHTTIDQSSGRHPITLKNVPAPLEKEESLILISYIILPLFWVGRDPSEPSSPTPGPAQDTPKSHTMCMKILFKCFLNTQAWCCDSFPGKPVPVLNHPLHEKPFPEIQP